MELACADQPELHLHRAQKVAVPVRLCEIYRQSQLVTCAHRLSILGKLAYYFNYQNEMYTNL